MKKIITSESVNIGHPDKTCDIIAGAFFDAALLKDPNTKMAIDCAIKEDLLMIYGNVITTAKINYEKIARVILKEIGYTCNFKIVKKISEGEVAPSQGIVYGYATNETPEFMPTPIMIAHKIMKRYQEYRKSPPNDIPDDEVVVYHNPDYYFLPDAKCQVSIEYDSNDKPVAVNSIVISVSHCESISNEEIEKLISLNVIQPTLSDYAHLSTTNMRLIINPGGKFTKWGSFALHGSVRRKIFVDTYGGVGRVGGGTRLGAHYCRFVAKNIVANEFAERCEVSVAYAGDLGEQLKTNIETFGTAKVPLVVINAYVEKNFNFQPSNIIRELDLIKSIYQQSACYGHYGREELPWEKVVKIS